MPKLRINTAHWTIHYILVEHDIALLTPTLVACVPASSGQKSPTWQGMLSTRIRTFPGRTAAHAWRWALFSSATVEGRSFMSRIQTDIWTQTCSIGFMSGLRAGQSMTSTSSWSKKLPCHMWWGGALSWTCTQLGPNTPIAHGNIWFPMIWIYRFRFRFMAPIYHDQLNPPPMMDCTPYHDWPAMISIVRLDAGISQPLPLPKAHADPTITVV